MGNVQRRCAAALSEDPASLPGHLVLAYAFSEFVRSGLLTKLAHTGYVSEAEIEGRYPGRALFINKAVAILIDGGLIRPAENGYARGKRFADYWRCAGPIYWLTHGNSSLMAGGLIEGGISPDRLRDYRAIATASALAGSQLIDPFLEPVFAALQPKFVADLGCGSGGRLISLAKEYDLFGIGFDLSEDSIALARRAADQEKMSSRLRFFHADVSALVDRYKDVDTVLSALMAHDLLPRDKAINVLRNLRVVFPSAERMIIVDTCKLDYSYEDRSFAAAFQYIHAILGIDIPTAPQWVEIIEASGWRVANIRPLGLPNTFAFMLRRI